MLEMLAVLLNWTSEISIFLYSAQIIKACIENKWSFVDLINQPGLNCFAALSK